MATLTRHVGVEVYIAGKLVTDDLSPYLKSFTYEEAHDGETDTVELELQDAERLFIGDWFPKRTDKIRVELWHEYWDGGGVESLDLGDFEIDELQNQYPPNVCKLKGNSCPSTSELRQVDESRSWENVKLSEIAQDIANDCGVELFFDASEDPVIKRAEMAESSRLAFLEKLCRDHGLALKFSDWLIIIFDEEKYEQQAPVKTFGYGSTIKSFSGTATLTEIYKACEVNYRDGKADELYSGRYEVPGKTGKVLKINQRVSDKGEAEKLAKKKLRDKNKEEIKISLTVTGDFALRAGRTIELQGHGFYDGKYLIERARHTIGSGYEVSIEARRCLEGY